MVSSCQIAHFTERADCYKTELTYLTPKPRQIATMLALTASLSCTMIRLTSHALELGNGRNLLFDLDFDL
jgi:hypothetical protein